MSENLTRRLIREHLVSGDMRPGQEVALKIDQTLTQDATGTMAYLEFESIGIPRVKTELSVSYIDHNCVQIGYRNADDHVFLQTLAKKYGIYLSKPGNGICHQVHMERFGIPGKTLLGYANRRMSWHAGHRGRGTGCSHGDGRNPLSCKNA